MAACAWCGKEMTTAVSCTVGAFHLAGRRIPMIAWGEEPGWGPTRVRCGDCGVAPGGFHHPGCDLQRCPVCGRQMMTCGCRFDEDFGDLIDDDDRDDWDDDGCFGGTVEPLGVDGNGLLMERMMMGDQEVIIHRDDVPESDITVVRGIRCTTALRTIIDCAPDLTKLELLQMLQECLERGLFTVGEAWQRIREPDMVGRRGAEMLRGVLPPHAA